MYSVYARVDDGEFLFVAACDELEQASKLARKLHASWPHEYIVRDPDGNTIEITP